MASLNRGQIEAWLERTLVPVEPNPAFIRNLQARLVTIRGQRLISPWMLLLVGIATVVMLATWLGVAVRILLGLLSLIGLLERSRRGAESPELNTAAIAVRAAGKAGD